MHKTQLHTCTKCNCTQAHCDAILCHNGRDRLEINSHVAIQQRQRRPSSRIAHTHTRYTVFSSRVLRGRLQSLTDEDLRLRLLHLVSSGFSLVRVGFFPATLVVVVGGLLFCYLVVVRDSVVTYGRCAFVLWTFLTYKSSGLSMALQLLWGRVI